MKWLIMLILIFSFSACAYDGISINIKLHVKYMTLADELGYGDKADEISKRLSQKQKDAMGKSDYDYTVATINRYLQIRIDNLEEKERENRRREKKPRENVGDIYWRLDSYYKDLARELGHTDKAYKLSSKLFKMRSDALGESLDKYASTTAKANQYLQTEIASLEEEREKLRQEILARPQKMREEAIARQRKMKDFTARRLNSGEIIPYIEVVECTTEWKDRESTDYTYLSRRINVTVTYRNLTDWQLKGIKGNITLKDSFGEVLVNAGIKGEGIVNPWTLSSDTWGWEDNPFIDDEPYDKCMNAVLAGTVQCKAIIDEIAWANGKITENKIREKSPIKKPESTKVKTEADKQDNQ